MFIKKVTPWLERWLHGALTALAEEEDWGSCPITFPLWWLITACKSRNRGSDVLSWPHGHADPHKRIHIVK